MKPIAAILASAALVVTLAGCADDDGTLGHAATAPAPTQAPHRTTTTPPRPDALYELWFVRGGLVPVRRTGKAGERAVARRALDALTAGPTAQEAADGDRTLLARGTKLDIDLEDGVATVVGLESGGGVRARLRRAQVVLTLTQYDTIEGVRFFASGPVLTRRDFGDLLPAIVVDEPRVGAPTQSRLTISGTANVFEATVSVRVLDAKGKTIARTFATATCGTGCRGDFSASVSYSVDEAQTGTVEVFEVSAENGRRTHVVAVPVRLTAAAG
jgi:hypothetical protein